VQEHEWTIFRDHEAQPRRNAYSASKAPAGNTSLAASG
jgi:hypothetical protein